MFTCRLCDMRCNFLRATLVIINDVLPLLCSCKSTLNRFNPYPQTTCKLKNTETKLHFVNKTHTHTHTWKRTRACTLFSISLSLHTQWTSICNVQQSMARVIVIFFGACAFPAILYESEKKHTDRKNSEETSGNEIPMCVERKRMKKSCRQMSLFIIYHIHLYFLIVTRTDLKVLTIFLRFMHE